jgi:hypothetical protein
MVAEYAFNHPTLKIKIITSKTSMCIPGVLSHTMWVIFLVTIFSLNFLSLQVERSILLLLNYRCDSCSVKWTSRTK